jgi:hypothetical protein
VQSNSTRKKWMLEFYRRAGAARYAREAEELLAA